MSKISIDITAVVDGEFRHLHAMESDVVSKGGEISLDNSDIVEWFDRRAGPTLDGQRIVEDLLSRINGLGDQRGCTLLAAAESDVGLPLVIQWQLNTVAPTSPQAIKPPKVEETLSCVSQVLLDVTMLDYEHGQVGVCRFVLGVPGQDFATVMYLIILQRPDGRRHFRLADSKALAKKLEALRCDESLQLQLQDLADSGADDDSQDYKFGDVLEYRKKGLESSSDVYYILASRTSELGVRWHWVLGGRSIFECQGSELGRK